MVTMKLQVFLVCAIIFALSEKTAGYVCTEKVCEYNFDIKHAITMTYLFDGRRLNVMLNGSGLSIAENRFHRNVPNGPIPLKDVFIADGFQRNILTVNDQFPGPTLEVMEGAEVVVHVTNYLLTHGVSIHWHGVHQKGTPWMDGVSYVTQCPIIPGQSFTYRFIASPVGTHWYHDHLTNLRSDGLYGMIVVHAKLPSLPQKHLLLSDWYHETAETVELNNFGPYNGAGNHLAYWKNREFGPDNVYASPFFFVSALINGKGRFNNNQAPLEVFAVTSGTKYRFRTLNAASTYGFEVSIDGHQLEVVALDGNEIKPIRVDSIMLNPAERVDFTVVADQPISNYWMRSLTLRIGTGVNPVADGVEKGTYAVVRYDGAQEVMPTTNKKTCTPSNPCIVFNCPWPGYANSYNKRCVALDDARSTASQEWLDDEYGLNSKVDLELFLNIGFHLHGSINGYAMVYPTLPFSEPDYKNGLVPCNNMECSNMNAGCSCSNIINLPFNKTVQLIMANYRPGKRVTHHPMHLHGHNFAVLKQGLPTFNTNTGFVNDTGYNPDVRCTSDFCKEIIWNTNNQGLNLDAPPVKDSINVPGRGYVVVRFRTLNPGPWLYHCHITNHFSEGMSLLFNEAPERQPSPPESFPKCPSFKWSERDFRRYMAHSMMQYDDDDKMNPLDPTYGDPAKEKEDSRSKEDEPETRAEGVTLANNEFIGLIIGCIAIGAVLVILVMLAINCGRPRQKVVANSPQL